MNNKLVVLVAILAVLMVGVVIKISMAPEELTIAEEVGAHQLVSEAFLLSEVSKDEESKDPEKAKLPIISKMSMYIGSNVDDKVELVRKEGEWYITSSHNAPGDKGKIEQFVQKLRGLTGIPRSTDQDLFADFKIEDEQAIHIEIHSKDKEGKESLFAHILVGDKEDAQSCFAREADSFTVYTVGHELRAELGVYGELKELEGNRWLNKKLLKLNKSDITQLALHYPDKKLVFSHVEKVVPPKDDKDKEGKKPKKQYEWKLTEGGFGKELKDNVIDGLLDKFSSFEIANVVDSSDKKKWGLDAPQFRVEISHKDSDKKVLLASRVEGKIYAMLEGKELVYTVNSWDFSNAFKSGDDFFDLLRVEIDKNSVAQIELTQANSKVILSAEKNGEEVVWKLATPALPYTLQKNVIDDLLRRLENLPMKDYADTKDQTLLGVANPDSQLVVAMKDGKKHVFKGGKKSLCLDDGRYLGYNDQHPTYAIEDYDYQKLFPSLGDLLQLDVANFTNITVLRVTHDEKVLVDLAKEGDSWTIMRDDKRVPADGTKVTELLNQCKPLTAKNISLDAKALVGKKAKATLEITDAGTNHTITLYDSNDGLVPMTISGQEWAYWLEETTADAFLGVDVEELTLPQQEDKAPAEKQEPEKQEPEEKEGEPEKTEEGK